MREVKNAPSSEPRLRWEPSDRAQPDVARGMCPEKLDAVLLAANSGDPRDQARLAREITERDWSVAAAVSTRRDALLGCAWTLKPGDDTPEAEDAARELEETLRGAGDREERSFDALLGALQDALLPGYAAAETLWLPGGGIAGFSPIPPECVAWDGETPCADVPGQAPGALPLEAPRFLVHATRLHGRDPVRGGLIRPLAWLHCFANLNIKDLSSFVERHGTPFIVAKVDPAAWSQERSQVKRLIRSFGPAGGGVFTRNVELQLLESTSTGEVYFRLLECLDAAVNKLVLGQTASSGDASGLSKGDAQSRVRQDILEADARRVARAAELHVVAPWMRFNHPGAAAPRMEFQVTPPEDTERLARTLASLRQAGLAADPAEMTRRFGITLTAVEAQPAAPAMPMGADDAPQAGTLAAEVARLDEPGISDEEFRRRLDAILDRRALRDTSRLEAALSSEFYSALALGAASKDRELAKRGGR